MTDKSLKNEAQYKRMQEFGNYYELTRKTTFSFFFSDGSIMSVPYKHRWSRAYRQGIIRKLYQLNMWVSRHGLNMGMISLTSKQAGLTDKQILEMQKEAWDKLRQTLYKMGLSYYVLYEPHKTGIPHMHVLIIGKITEDMVIRLRGLWHDKYEIGNEHDFEFSAEKKVIETTLVNYLMKYLSKTICEDVNKDDALMRFHSLFWAENYRLWSSSEYLSFVMRQVRKRDNSAILEKIVISGEMNKEIEIEHKNLFYPEYLEKSLKKDKMESVWMDLIENNSSDTVIYGICSPIDDDISKENKEIREELFWLCYKKKTCIPTDQMRLNIWMKVNQLEY